MDIHDKLGYAAQTLPKRVRKSHFFVVLYNTDSGLKYQEFATRKEASAFVEQIGYKAVEVAYKSSERITPQVKTTVSL